MVISGVLVHVLSESREIQCWTSKTEAARSFRLGARLRLVKLVIMHAYTCWNIFQMIGMLQYKI
jgi:hypothetical protein